MSTCGTCEHLQCVIRSKDEEIQRLQDALSSASPFAQLELEAQKYAIQVEQLTATLDSEKRDAAQKASELNAKLKELEKQVSSGSGKSSNDLDRVLSQLVYKENRILELNNTILDKERQILDLQEMCHEQGQVAQAKTQAMQIVQQKIIEFESRKSCDVGTETDLFLIPRVRRTRSGSPGHAIAQIKFGVRSSPPPLDPSEDMSSFTTEQNGFEENDDEPVGSRSVRAKKNRKKVTFDLPPSVASSTLNLPNDGAAADMMQTVSDLAAENDELRRVISDMENIEFAKYEEQVSGLQAELHASKLDGKNHVLKARAAAQGRIKDLEDRIALMQEQHFDETETLRTDIDTLTGAREWALIERARLQDEVDTCKMKLHDLHEKHRENEEVVFELNHRLAQEAQFSERLADDVQEAQFTANQLLEQKQMILDDVERLKEALLAQDELIGVLEADVMIYEEHIGILRDSLGATKKENRQIIKSKAFETKIRALEKEKEQMDKRSNDERLRTKALNAKVKTLKNENETLLQKLQEAESAIEAAAVSTCTPTERENSEALGDANEKMRWEQLEKEILEASEQLEVVRSHNFVLQSELSHLQEENQELKLEVVDLRRTSAINEEIPHTKTDCEVSAEILPNVALDQSVVSELEQKVQLLIQEKSTLNLQISAIEEEGKTKVALVEEEVAEYFNQITLLQSSIATLRQENDVLIAAKMQFEETLQQVRNECSQDSARNTESLELQLEAVFSENEVLQEERKVDEETLESLRRELVSANNEIEKKQLRVEMLLEQNSTVENTMKVMISEREAVEHQRNSDQSTILSLQGYVTELSAKLNGAEATVDHVEDLQADIQNLMKEVVELREENEKLSSIPARLLQATPTVENHNEEHVDASELFGGQNAELTRTPSGCLLLENQLLRDCVSETNRMHDDLTSDVNQMMLLNQELENAVDALKGEIWSLNDRLKKCFVEREELLGKIEASGEIEKAYHVLQKCYTDLVSKEIHEVGTDPMENTENHKNHWNALASIGAELKMLRDSDLQVVKNDLGQLIAVFHEMRGTAAPLLQRIVQESAAKLTTKQADNDALFRANAELAHTNVALQNQNAELQERLDEAVESNDRFYMDGQQLSEEKIAFFNNIIQGLEDRLELTENLNRELEEKCCDAEQREHVADSKIRGLEERIEQLAQLQPAPSNEISSSSGWDDWKSESSDTEDSTRTKVQPSQSVLEPKCQSCGNKDDNIKDLKVVIQEKKQEIAFLKDRRCPHCLTKEDELNEISLLLSEADEELNLLRKQVDSEVALRVGQAREELNECGNCKEKNMKLAEMQALLETKTVENRSLGEPVDEPLEQEAQTHVSVGGWDDWYESGENVETECSSRDLPPVGVTGWDGWNECKDCEEKELKLKLAENKVVLLNDELTKVGLEKDQLSQETNGSQKWKEISEQNKEKMHLTLKNLQALQKEIDELKRTSTDELVKLSELSQSDLRIMGVYYADKMKTTKQNILAYKKKVVSLKTQNELLKDSECRLADSNDLYVSEIEKLQESLVMLRERSEKTACAHESEKTALMENVCSLEKKVKIAGNESAELKQTITLKDTAIDDLKQALVHKSDQTSEISMHKQLAEMERQRDEAKLKLAELHKKFKLMQQRGRLSASSKASISESSVIPLNEEDVPSSSRQIDHPDSTPLTSTFSYNPYDFASSGIASDSFRRRTSKK